MVQEYSSSLANELKNDNKENFFATGLTANLVSTYIGKQCGIYELITENTMEKMRIELITVKFGIKLLLNLIAGQSIKYVGNENIRKNLSNGNNPTTENEI